MWTALSIFGVLFVIVIAAKAVDRLLPEKRLTEEDRRDHAENCEVCRDLCEECRRIP